MSIITNTTTDVNTSDNQILLQHALECARLGMPVINLHGIAQNGNGELVCSCGDPNCNAPGKRPWATKWQNQATTDDETIRKWLHPRQKPSNFGLLIGPQATKLGCQPYIDLEIDNDEGLDFLSDDVFGGSIPDAPTWTSGRGEHRLFAYHECLPQMARLPFPPNGFGGKGDILIGAGPSPSQQTVAPPCPHQNGSVRKWIVRPSDVPPPKLTEKQALRFCAWREMKSSGGGSTTTFDMGQVIRELPTGKRDGSRHVDFLRFGLKMINHIDIQRESSVVALTELCHALNDIAEGSHKRTRDEVNSEIKSGLAKRAAEESQITFEQAEQATSISEDDGTGARLCLVESDPCFFELRWPKIAGDRLMVFSVAQFKDVHQFAIRFEEQCGSEPPPWLVAQWRPKKGKGYCQKLKDHMTTRQGAPDESREGRCALMLYEILIESPQTRETAAQYRRTNEDYYVHEWDKADDSIRYRGSWMSSMVKGMTNESPYGRLVPRMLDGCGRKRKTINSNTWYEMSAAAMNSLKAIFDPGGPSYTEWRAARREEAEERDKESKSRQAELDKENDRKSELRSRGIQC